MTRPIVHDFWLAQKSEPAIEPDRQIITDLMDTLRDKLNRCVAYLPSFPLYGNI